MKTIIIGAGPASLMAATKAIERGHEVVVFEKMKTAGRKFLVAGEGGFNLTHTGTIDEIVSYYSHPQIAQIIRQFTNEDLIAWLKEIGIGTYVGSSGKVFPIKEIKPAMVLNTWLKHLKLQGVQFVFNASLENFDANSVQIKTKTGTEIHSFDKLILGLGTASWPKTGSDAAWVELFQTKNIHVTPFQPSNAGVNCHLPNEFLLKFQGSVFKNVVVRHYETTRMGEVVLTKYGVEGAPIYYLNPSIRKDLSNPITIDFKPNFQSEEISAFLSKSKNISEGLKKLKLPNAFISWCKNYLSKEEFTTIDRITSLIKQFPIIVRSFRPIDEAISCCGGVAWTELNENLSLKKFPNIHVVGEMLDWEAPTGGYLLQGAFSTGFYVGEKLI
jgi:hypothetical protein